MAEPGRHLDSLRPSRFYMERVTLALLLSLLVHLAGYGGYQLGKKIPLLAWLYQHRAQLKQLAQQKNPPREEPLEFVTVENPSTEAPKNAKYYGAKNSVAANPNATIETQTPKITGHQKNVPKAQDVPKKDFSKLQPTPKPQQQQAQEQKAVQSGDLTLGKAQKEQQPRPRTIKEAMAQQHKTPGQAMQQNGGVRRMSVASLNVKATAFGAYDAELIDAVTQRWYDLLDKNRFAYDRQGKVIIRFTLHSDGRLTGLEIQEDTVDDHPKGIWAIVCQAALEQAAPFAPWPSDMQRMIGDNIRPVTFEFFY